MKGAPVIEVEDLWFKRNSEEILQGINLRVMQGDVYAILGPNGGGKTTLLKVILGLIPPDRGTVRILGGLPSENRHLLGYVPQLHTFDFHYPISVREMVLSGLLGRKTGIFKTFTAADMALADKALATMGIGHLTGRAIRDLSGGEQQRAVIARALVGDPRVLLLDEPTVFVDAPTETQFYDILGNLARTITIKLVTHDIGVVVSHVTKVACLNRRLFTHDSRELTEDMIQGAYYCPVDIIAHGHPHRVLRPASTGGMTVFSLLGYTFFQNALIAGVLASIACGIIGTFVVIRRMVAISGGISHAAFGGIGLGYFLGIEPLLGALGFTVGAALTMGELEQRTEQHMDTLIGAIWATGMALGILFIYLTPGFAPDLFGYLFGNILLVPQGDLLLMLVLVAVIVITVGILLNDLVAVTFDQEYAAVINLPVERLMLVLLVLIALTVVMLIQVVGIILVIALLTLPAAISRECTAQVKTMMLYAVLLGIAFTTTGIFLSALLNIPSGATIILVSAAIYGSVLVKKRLAGR